MQTIVLIVTHTNRDIRISRYKNSLGAHEDQREHEPSKFHHGQFPDKDRRHFTAHIYANHDPDNGESELTGLRRETVTTNERTGQKLTKTANFGNQTPQYARTRNK